MGYGQSGGGIGGDTPSGPILPAAYINEFVQVTDVSQGDETVILTYVVPVDHVLYLQRIVTGGTHVAEYRVEVQGGVESLLRTHFASPLHVTHEFFGDPNTAYPIDHNQQVQIIVRNYNQETCGTGAADFEARLQGVLYPRGL